MTTGSLCLTEILKSWKSCSSKRLASHTADSTSASGGALPYFSSSRGSREPALTPIRIEVPRSLAAAAISLTWSSNLRMLPGLTRTAAQPASIAAKTYFGWKWMSAITGICECRAISGSASASSCDGQATRTMSQPAAVSSAICCSVVFTSEVRVVVIDCTETGASPPTSTLPTLICRVLRRGASTGGGAAGMPRLTDVMTGPSLLFALSRFVAVVRAVRRAAGWPWGRAAPLADADRGDDVGVDEDQAGDQDDAGHHVAPREQLGDVDETGVGTAKHPGHATSCPFVHRTGDVATVERQQRHEVQQAEEQVEPGDQQ